MSKPLATKVRTPLSEKSKLGPKCQYFVWPPLFSSTALILVGMEFTRASQVATGVLFHSTSLVMTHYPTDSGVASIREKTEEPHPQALQPKEDGTQSPWTWCSRSAMPLYGVCMCMEYVKRWQKCCIWKIRATVDSETRPPFQAHYPKQTHAYSLCLSHQATSKGYKIEHRKHKPSTCTLSKRDSHPLSVFSITSICSY